MISQGKFSGLVNQSVRFVHTCLVLVILIPKSTYNSGQKSVVFFTQGANMHGVVGVNVKCCSKCDDVCKKHVVWAANHDMLSVCVCMIAIVGVVDLPVNPLSGTLDNGI